MVGGEHLKEPQMRTLASGMCVLLRMYVVRRRCVFFSCAFCCVFCILVLEAPSAADGHLLQIAFRWRSEGGSEGRGRELGGGGGGG